MGSLPCQNLMVQMCAIRQRALRKRNFVVMGPVMKVLWQDHTFVIKRTMSIEKI